eukprot:TRINITY_DN945_c0_g1_i1.p1 TRINITY_DN945_c0_g1~~TRINITY_DN945_c0_g1_i1.p1  ORF type:complete len:1942 (+),score=229.96 TRINITY_DN945_c0_g1_i1:4143-9968(+)
MAYVDDLKFTFDAADFCQQLTAAIGHGRFSSEAALKQPSALPAASTALHKFLAHAKSDDAPDVIAAYVSYSPRAAELFNSLRAVNVDPSVASVAFECLIEIVRYSLIPHKPADTLERVRSVVRNIVRTYAPLITDVLVKDKRACARKGLELLRLTAMCHPLLAKELLNKYDFSSKRLASILCSTSNNYCRMPFLDLLFSVITCSKRDVHLFLSRNAREMLIACLSTITRRTIHEAHELTSSTKRSAKSTESTAAEQKAALPGYVQKRELIASINYLLALQKHLFDDMPKHVRRKTFAAPMCTMLAKIACTELPPTSVAPRQVQSDHKALRKTAGDLFIAFAKDVDGALLRYAADSLLATSLIHGSSAATTFSVKAIEAQPRLSTLLLEHGPFLSSSPEPSTKWLSFCSVLATSLMRLSTLPPALSTHTFLERCLSHNSSIVRHFGHLFTLSCCRIIQENDQYMENLEIYLPSVDFLKQTLRKEKSGDALVQKLLAQYQLIFSRKVDKRKTILMNAAVLKSSGNILEAENSIRAGLQVAPKETVTMAMNHKLFSRLVLQACISKDKRLSQRLWHLAADILNHSFLFPKTTKYEVEVFLSVISGLGTERNVCIDAIESMLCAALANPYGLYDQLNIIIPLEDGTSPLVSLFFIATLLRIRRLKEPKKSLQGMSESEQKLFEASLVRIVECIIASMIVLDPNTERNSLLMSSVSRFVSIDSFWWDLDKVVEPVQSTEHIVKACICLKELLHNRGTYPRTPFFMLLSSLCECFLRSSSEQDDVESVSDLHGIDVAWDSWQDFRSGELTSFNSFRLNLETNAVPRFFLHLYATKGISGCTFEDQLRALKQSLPMRDYLALFCAVFRTTNSPLIRNLLLPELLAELTQSSGKDQESREVFYCLGTALIACIRGTAQWDRDSIQAIISSCISALESCGADSFSKQRIAFCTAVLYNLTQHRYPFVSVCSYLLLNDTKHLNATFLPSLSVHCSKQLSELLPHFPALLEALTEHVLTWADGAGRPFAFPMLVLLQRLLGRKSSLSQESISEGKWKSSLLHLIEDMAFLKQDPDCSEGQTYQVIVEGIQKLGEHVIFNLSAAKELVEVMKKHWTSSRTLPAFMWILWNKVFTSQGSLRLELVVANEVITELLVLFVDCITNIQEKLSDLSILQVFSGVLRYVRLKKCLSCLSISDSSDIEKKLLDLSRRATGMAAKYKDGMVSGMPLHETECLSSKHYDLLCWALSEMLGLDMMVDDIAKESIIVLCNDVTSLESLVGADPNNIYTSHTEPRFLHSSSHAHRCSTINVLNAALSRMDTSKVSEEVQHSLHNIEEVFSCLSVHGASSGEGHENIRSILNRIADIYRLTYHSKQSLQVYRSNVSSNASKILPSFDKRVLEDACHLLLAPEAEANWLCDQTVQNKDSKASLDPQFVLQLLLRGFGEALEKPSQPVLDINFVVREGLLGLALTGLASHKEAIRSLSYACLELLRRVLTSTHLKTQGAAAALYKDRKQLVFLIEVLRNSITEPLTQSLPLFIVWFRTSLIVALNPRHPANKIVTTFFLRSPTVDVRDCLGLYHLLHCNAVGDELLPTRSLAFEVLAKGVRTKKDIAVLRKRRIINTVFLYGLRKSLFNSSLSFTALRTLSILVERDYELDVAYELVSKYGIVSWLVQDTLEGGESERQLVVKLETISKLGRALKGCPNLEEHVTLLSIALKHLARTVLAQRKYIPDELLRSLSDCGVQICEMMPELRHSIRFDFSEVYDHNRSRDQNEAERQRTTSALSKCIVRQQNVCVSQETRRMLLTQTIVRFSDATDDKFESELPEKMMYHTFLAECFVDECVRKRNAVIDTTSLELLAKSLLTQPSIWIILAAYAVLDAGKNISGSLLALSNSLPSAPPKVIRTDMDQRYDSIVKNGDLVRTICSKLLSMSHGRGMNSEALCEPKSASSSE